MRRLILAIAVAAAMTGGQAAPALAFQEQTIGGGAGKDSAAAPGLQMPNLNLSLPDANAGNGGGMEVRIPGVGTVGALPKLDFGLELLYGASEPPIGRFDERSQPSDVQIRGTIKHRF